MIKNKDDVSKDELIRAINKECLGCNRTELAVAKCNELYCPLHQYRSLFIDIDEILSDKENKIIIAEIEKRVEKITAKKEKDKDAPTPRKLSIPKKKD